MVERGEYVGVRIDPCTGRPIQVDEAEHFISAQNAGTWVDQEEELPHPSVDKAQ
jgi:hypothetical protein